MLIYSPENNFYMLSCYGNLVGIGNLPVDSFDFPYVYNHQIIYISSFPLFIGLYSIPWLTRSDWPSSSASIAGSSGLCEPQLPHTSVISKAAF